MRPPDSSVLAQVRHRIVGLGYNPDEPTQGILE